jgi:hypothetical protein
MVDVVNLFYLDFVGVENLTDNILSEGLDAAGCIHDEI